MKTCFQSCNLGPAECGRFSLGSPSKRLSICWAFCLEELIQQNIVMLMIKKRKLKNTKNYWKIYLSTLFLAHVITTLILIFVLSSIINTSESNDSSTVIFLIFITSLYLIIIGSLAVINIISLTIYYRKNRPRGLSLFFVGVSFAASTYILVVYPIGLLIDRFFA